MNKYRLFAIVLAVALLTTALPVAAPWAGPDAETLSKPVPGRAIVKLAPGASLSGIAMAAGGRVGRGLGDGQTYVLHVSPGSEQAVVRRLAARPDVVYAEPVWPRQTHQDPNDPGYAQLKWDVHEILPDPLCDAHNDCADGDANIAWDAAYAFLGAGFDGGAIIAVIDSGIDENHPDLDDKLVDGWDALEPGTYPRDTNGHGTHVAGTAAAETGNATGTVGVGYSPNIKVMPLRACDTAGSCPSDAIVAAIDWALDLPEEARPDVINLSLGGPMYSYAEEDAINRAWAAGCVVVASAGNEGYEIVSYPAAYENAIAVGATNWHGERASYSNYGPELDVVAPGGEITYYHDPSGIYSTMPTYDVYLTTKRYRYSNNYDQLQGTSQAAPQVSGLAALLVAVGVESNVAVRQIIESSCDVPESYCGDAVPCPWDGKYGWGRINALDAVLAASGPPSWVSIVAPTEGEFVSGTVDVDAATSDDITDVTFFVDGNPIPGPVNVEGNMWSVAWTTGVPDGPRTLTAEAMNGAGPAASDSIDVTVDNYNDAPVAVFSYSCGGPSCVFDAVDSYDPDGSIVSYSWDFGDGSDPESGQTASHTYGGAGIYEVVLTVTDDDVDAAVGGSQKQDVQVSEAPPTMHVADIDGESEPYLKGWQAWVTLMVHDATDLPVSDVDVTAVWSGGISAHTACTTGAGGTCLIQSPPINKRATSVTFTVLNLERDGFEYDPGANVESDITIARPW